MSCSKNPVHVLQRQAWSESKRQAIRTYAVHNPAITWRSIKRWFETNNPAQELTHSQISNILNPKRPRGPDLVPPSLNISIYSLEAYWPPSRQYACTGSILYSLSRGWGSHGDGAHRSRGQATETQVCTCYNSISLAIANWPHNILATWRERPFLPLLEVVEVCAGNGVGGLDMTLGFPVDILGSELLRRRDSYTHLLNKIAWNLPSPRVCQTELVHQVLALYSATKSSH